MNTLTTKLNPANLSDKTVLAESDLASLELWRLPKKIRLRVRRPNGNVQIKHIGQAIHVTFVSESDFGSWENNDIVYRIIDQALSDARWALRDERQANPFFRSAMNGRIEIALPEKITGESALEALDKAVEAIVQKANSLLAVAAQGIRLKAPDDAEDFD